MLLQTMSCSTFHSVPSVLPLSPSPRAHAISGSGRSSPRAAVSSGVLASSNSSTFAAAPAAVDCRGRPFALSSTVQAEEEEEEEELDIERHVLRDDDDDKYLSEISSWGIGGPCRHFLTVSRTSHLISALRYCRSRSMEFIIVGKGSNCLFSDLGFDGFVILNRILDFEMVGPGTFRVGSGYPFNRLGMWCSREGLSGLEFAGGIPGTAGGAVFMNAGADGQETEDVISSVEIVTRNGELRVLSRNQIDFGYRWSSFQEMEDLAAILAVTFKLIPETTARDRQRFLWQRRKRSQPVGERSAGSVFRNPSGIGKSAGELIELAGLKGFQLGGAKVSDIHANFFINFNGSTSSEMMALINFVKERVYQVFQIELREEVKYVPYRKLII